MKAFLIHGAFGSPEENWLPWLRDELRYNEYIVKVPQFPTPDGQNLEAWMRVFEKYRGEVDAETILVGHSIGATFLLSVLETLDVQVAGVFLISGFVRQLGIDEFDEVNTTFVEKTFDWARIRENAKQFAVLHGDNDPYVPKKYAEELAEKLGVSVEWVKGGGHLNTAAGCSAFPQLYERIIG